MSEGEQNEQQQQQSVIDEFELKSQIANGNASQIWEVTMAGNTTPLAMKLLLPEPAQSAHELGVLKHEFKVGSSLDHPNCVRFHKVVAKKGQAYIVMDYFRSANLKSQIMRDLPGLQSRIRKLIEGVCMSLGYMHEKGWIHRDIKPDNILMSKSSEMRLIDFSLSTKAMSGLAKLLSGKSKTIQGTRTYIAPETILKKPATIQTDIYSFGITLYEILTGIPPFTGTSPSEILKRHISAKPVPPSATNPNVKPEMDQFVARLLAKKPEQRPKDMNEVFAEFRSVKVFHEEPLELMERLKQEAKKASETASSIDSRLDSRSDADRKNKVITKGESKAGQGAQKTEPPKQEQPLPQPTPQQPVPQPAMQPGMMPQQPMMHPGMMQQPMMQPPPGMMMPQQPMMMPQQPMMNPAAMPQQMAMPQQPMAHPGQMPQQPVTQPPQPQQPTPQPQPVGNAAPAAAPQQPAPASPSPSPVVAEQPKPTAAAPAPAPAAAPEKAAVAKPAPEPPVENEPDDIPLMTELPDVF